MRTTLDIDGGVSFDHPLPLKALGNKAAEHAVLI